jgi:putative ABC transport system ATP-binding protein
MKVSSEDILIEVRNAVKSYKSEAGEFRALKGVNFKIAKGEFVSIVGKSGSGKSTLLNLISGIDTPSEGEIIIDKNSINSMSQNLITEWRGKNIGIVFQFFQLMPTLTVIENVMLPMDFCKTYVPAKRFSIAKDLLEKVGVSKHADKFPSALSGGEQQRVAIARALSNNPPIIIADEPTGNLDSNTSNDIFNLFDKLQKEGKTIVMVTHNMELAEKSSHIIKVQDGEIVSDKTKINLA